MTIDTYKGNSEDFKIFQNLAHIRHCYRCDMIGNIDIF